MEQDLRKQARVWRGWSISDCYVAALDAFLRGDDAGVQWHLDKASELIWKLNASVPF